MLVKELTEVIQKVSSYREFKFHITALRMSFINFLPNRSHFQLPLPKFSLIFSIRFLRKRDLELDNIKIVSSYIVKKKYKKVCIKDNIKSQEKLTSSRSTKPARHPPLDHILSTIPRTLLLTLHLVLPSMSRA